MQAKGDLGLIATNTVAQGDTREVGLDTMVANGFTITRAIQSRSWPASTANLEYAAVWGTLAPLARDLLRIADEIPVRAISTLLEPVGRVEGRPVPLAENRGIAFKGSMVYGMGFVLDPDEAQEWIAADASNAEVLFPFLNGEDLNSRPDCSPSRWVIDFNERSEAAAAAYPVPYARALERVKPERMKNNRAVRRERWWQYGENAPGLRKAVSALSEAFAITRVSKTVMPVRVPTGQVFSDSLIAFASADYSDQAVLSSSLHQLWAITYGSTLETRVRYTPSDVFDTFPRPAPTARLEQAGRTLDTERRAIMQRRELGLTKLYNLVNDHAVQGDDDVAHIRAIHAEVDGATVAAYGWDDLRLQHGFHTYRQAERWSIPSSARVELLDRLLAENHRRGGANIRPSANPPLSVAMEDTLFS